MHMTVIWLAALVVFAGAEAATVGLTCVWFAVGALAALFTSYFTDQVVIQAAVFLVVSLASLIAVRPFAHRFLQSRKVATNADRIIGTEAVVTEEIDNLKGCGRVSVGSMPWTARSANDAVIPAGETVRILRIEGVKVFVERKQSKEE